LRPRLAVDERSAREGDILVARVGRSIPDRIVRVSSGVNSISDCVFRIRCPPELIPRVWAGLRSEMGRGQLERAQAGLTARFLPMRGLLSVGV
jgi:type I restriction enzyme M protein